MKKLRVFAIILLAGLTIVAAGCKKQEEGAPKGMKSASASQTEYNLYVPSDWTIDTTEGSLLSSAHVSDADHTNVTAMAYTGDRSYKSVTEYFDNYKKQIEKMFDLDSEGKNTFEMVTDGEGVLLGGVAAQNYVYTGTVGGVALKYRQVICYYDGDYYLITFTSDADLYDTHAEVFDLIVQNFTFVKKPAAAVTTEATEG